jgi:iron complex outermembrane receptor protein
MKNILLSTSLSALAASMAITAGANAQSLDYTAMSELFGEPVTAGATGAPQRASDVPATMIIITQDDIGRFPEYDIPGILRHYAGVNFNRYGYGDGQISIRGAATPYSPRLLVLVNGREVYLDSYGYTAWSTLPVQLEEIQQIEVVKGAQSALYGFNAVSGVVNIITRNPQHGEYLTTRVNVDSEGGYDAAFVAARQFGERASVRVSYGNSETSELPAYEGGIDVQTRAIPDFSRETGAIEGRIRITDKISLNGEATFTNVDELGITSVYTASRAVYELVSYLGTIEADTDFGFITATVYRNESEIEYSFGPLSSSLTTWRIQDLFKLGTRNTFRIGAEFRNGETASFPDPGNGDFGYESTAFSVMWNHKFSTALDLTLAGRYDSVDWSRDGAPAATYIFTQDDYSVSFEEFSYNAALVWRPSFGGSVRVMAGRGIQAPTSFDIGFGLQSTVGGNPLILSGNPNMIPSIVDSYEIAYDRALTPTVNLRAAVFMQDTADVRGLFGLFPDVLPPAATIPTLLFDNRGDTSTTGVELGLEGNPDGHWDWDVNYTFQQAEDDLDGTFGASHVQNYEGATPEHLFNAHLGWTGERFTADGYVNYVSETTSPFQATFGLPSQVAVDSYVALSFRAGYRLNDHVSVSLSAQNANFGGGEVTNVNTESESRFWFGLTGSF